jgi:hypothetical protein
LSVLSAIQESLRCFRKSRPRLSTSTAAANRRT